jgi:bacillithiol system protein YtxJ
MSCLQQKYIIKSSFKSLMWTQLSSEDQLKEIIDLSKQRHVLIFKHSTRCSISTMALSRLERSWDLSAEEIYPFLIDILQFRSLSSSVASIFSISHESPQVLLVKDGKCIYHQSHNGINLSEIKSIVKN